MSRPAHRLITVHRAGRDEVLEVACHPTDDGVEVEVVDPPADLEPEEQAEAEAAALAEYLEDPSGDAADRYADSMERGESPYDYD